VASEGSVVLCANLDGSLVERRVGDEKVTARAQRSGA
jgi:hypothetical protein